MGILSLILGFALQTPITSFIAWIYILVRTPYRVGDRIKIGEATGYVVEPRSAGRVKNKLIDKMLEALNAEPERVMFPRGAPR